MTGSRQAALKKIKNWHIVFTMLGKHPTAPKKLNGRHATFAKLEYFTVLISSKYCLFHVIKVWKGAVGWRSKTISLPKVSARMI